MGNPLVLSGFAIHGASYKRKHDEYAKMYVAAAGGPGGAQFAVNWATVMHAGRINVSSGGLMEVPAGW